MFEAILAEAGLSECSGHPGIPACQQFNQGFGFFLLGLVGVFMTGIMGLCVALRAAKAEAAQPTRWGLALVIANLGSLVLLVFSVVG
ncbi:hypothetical protein [Mycobacteroides franklinii]|uniref:hypothetical protein n=1 Tax=Mycobacteroides franklinii TaxID=948102 RepID=UPI0013E8E89A|nr:hypothetical protein [Mycobacteroides franklinii]